MYDKCEGKKLFLTSCTVIYMVANTVHLANQLYNDRKMVHKQNGGSEVVSIYTLS